MGVVVRRYIDILIIILVLALFLAAALASLLLCSSIKKNFFPVYVIFVQYTSSKRCSKNISRSFKNGDHANMAI